MEESELRAQLMIACDELRKEQEEKCRALAKAELFELEAEDARDSEKKMLDSLVSQTKQLVQTKIALEEAKLKMDHLNDAIKIMVDPDEVQTLRAELKRALAADERSKKAMDGLAIALKEVTTEFSVAQSEVERLRAVIDRLKSEAEESSAAWRAKESGFINCIKTFEEEIASMARENGRLNDAKRAAKEEISNLRDIVKQAIKETNAVKEELEMSRDDNCRLKKLLLEKDKGNGEGPRSGKVMVKFPSDSWGRWSSVGDSKLLEGTIFEKDGRGYDDLEMFDAVRMRKKRQGIRRMLRMRSFHK